MKKHPKIKDVFDSARSQSLAKENLLFLHHRSLENMITQMEEGNHEMALGWAKIFRETVSDEKLGQFSKGFAGYCSSFGITEPIDFQTHIDIISEWSRNLIENTYSEADFQKKLLSVFIHVQQPAITLRAKLSKEESEVLNTDLADKLVRRQMLLSDPITNKDEIIKDTIDSDFLDLISPLEKAKDQEQQKRPRVIAIFEFVSREFPKMNKTAQAKLTGYVAGAIGVFDSQDEFNKSERNTTYPAYLANAARSHLKKSNQI